nr:peptide ABC transporter substrate-binding protein [Clostridium aestuarii]
MTTVLAGCGSKKVKGNNISLDVPVTKTLDSSLGSDMASFTTINACFEGLARSNSDKPEPAGAKEWKISDDGKVYTFTLRDNTWSDGKPVTAQDYEYAWKRLLNPNTKATYAFFLMGVKNASKYYKGQAKTEDLGIKALDEKTFQVTLVQPMPYFLQMTAFPVLSPLRKDIVETQGDKYGTDISKMVFNGPFAISEWQKGAKTILKKNDKYWDKDNVKLDSVNLVVTKELSTKYQMFSSKELDAIPATGEYAQKLKDDGQAQKCKYLEEVMPSAFYMEMNQTGKNKLLTNAKIRLALSLAIDREAYVNKIYKRGFVATGLVPTGLSCGDANTKFRDNVKEPLTPVLAENRNLKALFKEGLKELGLESDPSKYTIRYLPQNNDAFNRQSAEFFQNQWQSKLGVNIKLDSAASFSDSINKLQTGNFEIAMSGWGADFDDPISFIGLFQKDNGNNYGKYNGPKYEAIVEKINNETDNAKRMELFKQAEKVLIVEDAGIAPVFYKDKRYASQNNIKELQFPSFGPMYEFKWTSTEAK